MRAKRDLSYVVDYMPDVPEIFKFIQEKGNLSNKEMYATFNMGAGFAMMVDGKNANKIIRMAKKHEIRAWLGGRVEKGSKQVNIKPLNITYTGNELKIR